MASLGKLIKFRFQDLYIENLPNNNPGRPFAIEGPIIESFCQAIGEAIESRNPVFSDFKADAFICPSCKSKGPHKPHLVQPVVYGGRNAVDYYSCQTCGTMFQAVPNNKPKESDDTNYGGIQ